MHDLEMIRRLNSGAESERAARLARAFNGAGGEHPKDAEKGRFATEAAQRSRKTKPRRQLLGALGATIV